MSIQALSSLPPKVLSLLDVFRVRGQFVFGSEAFRVGVDRLGFGRSEEAEDDGKDDEEDEQSESD